MSTAVTTPYVTLEDYLEMDPEPFTQYFWLEGIVYAMSGGTAEHGRLTARVATALSRIGGEDCDVYGSTADIWVDRAQFYGQADASLVCGALRTFSVKRRNKTLGEAITNPVVIVEVLSPSTQAHDRGKKFEAYSQLASLEEYLLVEQAERRVEVRRRAKDGWSIEVVTGGGSITIHGTVVALDELYGKGSTAKADARS